MYCTAAFRLRLLPRVPGHPVWVSRGDHRHGSSSGPWILLCRRWLNSCRTSCASSTRFSVFPSRLSKCPRSCLITSLCAPLCATRSWWNSWWKCRLSYPILPCSGLRSSTSTFQFLVVEGDTLVFKVFLPDRVQQRHFPPRNAFLSGLWSRSSIFQVEAFMIFAQDRVHPLLRTFQLVLMMLWMSLVKVFFRTFPQNKKSAKLASHPSPRVPASVSSSTLAAQPVSDSWWESLTRFQQAVLEEARAAVRREHESKRKRKKKRKRKLPRVSSCGYKFLPRSRRLLGMNSTLSLRDGGPWLLRSILAASCLHGCLEAQDARHPGRYGPEGGFFCCDTMTKSVSRAVRTWKPGLSASHWYLTAASSVFVLPDCCGGFFWELTSGFIPVFSAVWFDNGYMCLSVHGGLGVCWLRCTSRCAPCRAENCGESAVAVHQGRLSSCRYAEADPMVSQTIEIPQLLDKVANVPVALLCRFSRAGCG